MQQIKLGEFGITILLSADGKGGCIESTLHETCPICGRTACLEGCETLATDEGREADQRRRLHNAAIDGIESLTLALACEDADFVVSEPFANALRGAIQACAKQFE